MNELVFWKINLDYNIDKMKSVIAAQPKSIIIKTEPAKEHLSYTFSKLGPMS